MKKFCAFLLVCFTLFSEWPLQGADKDPVQNTSTYEQVDPVQDSTTFEQADPLLLNSSTTPKSAYSMIQQCNLSSLEWIDEDWPNESYKKYIERCLRYHQHPQESKKRRIVFRLFDELTSQKAAQEHNVLYDMITAQDLQLFCGQRVGEPYLAQLVDRTKTQLGKVFLYGLIGSPTNNVEVLKNRQKIAKCFIDDEVLGEQVSSAYRECAAHENILLSFWAQDGFVQALNKKYFTIPYFKDLNASLNSSSTALQIRSMMQHQQRFLFVLSGALAAVLLPLYGAYKLYNAQLPAPLNNIAENLRGAGGSVLGLLASVNNSYAPGIAAIAAGITAGFGCKEEYVWARDNLILDQCVQIKMKSLASFFKALQKLKQTLAAAPALLEQSEAARSIVAFFDESVVQDEHLSHFMELMGSPTFNSEPSFFLNHGEVLLAYDLMYKVKKKLEPLLLALGEVDAYHSIATLYKEYSPKRVHFCFVKYKKKKHSSSMVKSPSSVKSQSVIYSPSVTMTKFWNPFVDAHKVLTNDLNVKGSTRNMVITGPNAGGKSTLIKAIAINLILSLSLGIMAADSAETTPFHAIATYLNVVDDIASGNSLFKAQVLRAQQMVELVEKTPSDEFSFIALDEMFNGTSAKESKAAAYSVAKHIGNYPNNMCVMATHFPLLTRLADEQSGFVNYKVSVEVDPIKGIYYPFKMEKGISNQHIALDILREEGYACTIVDEALHVLNRKVGR